jgi:hypothetical protein
MFLLEVNQATGLNFDTIPIEQKNSSKKPNSNKDSFFKINPTLLNGTFTRPKLNMHS